MIYADTSALAKLVLQEPQTPALRDWLRAHPVPVVTNVIGVVELQRLSARVSAAAQETATLVLGRIDKLTLGDAVLALAGRLPPAEARTLDALHIASAALLNPLQAVLTYDHRMLAAAEHYGLPVAAPGADTG